MEYALMLLYEKGTIPILQSLYLGSAGSEIIQDLIEAITRNKIAKEKGRNDSCDNQDTLPFLICHQDI